MLTAVGDISEEEWNDRYDWMAARNEEYFILCITDDQGKVVAVGSLIIEKKLCDFSLSLSHVLNCCD